MFYVPNIKACQELPVEEAGHCARVLRMKEGDHIQITDGCGSFYEAELTLVSPKRCLFRILNQEKPSSFPYEQFHHATGPPIHISHHG